MLTMTEKDERERERREKQRLNENLISQRFEAEVNIDMVDLLRFYQSVKSNAWNNNAVASTYTT